ncbi:MAG: DNA topoisomerase IV subunit B, partial [Microbacteriaceae bacterium]|nr:DNA topoisomerase IV subunit B [Microbacteriaceae bacterium]
MSERQEHQSGADHRVPGAHRVENAYGASEIQVLEGLEAVRKRPGMYIGSTGPEGLHHLVYEIVDNSVDESLAGYCDDITVTLLDDGGVRVVDNGRGIPVSTHPVEGISTLEVVLTKLHAGGKFGGGGYAVSGGLHGVGSSVVNALSHRFIAEVRRDGSEWRMEFRDGVPQGPLEEVGAAEDTGTRITFYPNADIFETVEFDYETLRTRFQQMAFLNRGLRITLVDERDPATLTPELTSVSEVLKEVDADATDAPVDDVAAPITAAIPVVTETAERAPRIQVFKYDRGLVDYVEHLVKRKKVDTVHDEVIEMT